METIKLLLPAIITLMGNIIFYIIIKQSVDKSIEKQKITYAGIFKEKIFIYKEILTRLYDIRKNIYQYQLIGEDEKKKEVILSINDFISFYLINQPFLSKNMLNNLQIIRDEYQKVFDSFLMYFETSKSISDPTQLAPIFQSFVESTSKLRKADAFSNVENLIILEMKKDLKIDEL